MNWSQLFSLASGILFVVGFVPFIRGMFRGQVTPAKGTWLVYALLDTSVLVNMVLAGVLNVLQLCALACSSVVFLLVLKFGEPGWTVGDKLCAAGAAIALAFYALPEVGQVIGLAVMFLGSTQIFLGAWREPGSQGGRFAWNVWTLATVSAVLEVFVGDDWSAARFAQPVVFLAIQLIMFSLVNFRRAAPPVVV